MTTLKKTEQTAATSTFLSCEAEPQGFCFMCYYKRRQASWVKNRVLKKGCMHICMWKYIASLLAITYSWSPFYLNQSVHYLHHSLIHLGKKTQMSTRSESYIQSDKMVLLSMRKMKKQSWARHLTDTWADSPTLSPSLPWMFCEFDTTSEPSSSEKKKQIGVFYSGNWGNKLNVPLRTDPSKNNCIKHK